MRSDLIILVLIIICIIIVYKNNLLDLIGISKTNEPFFDEKTELINAIADKLHISNRRIVNLEYSFYPEGSNNLIVRFGILAKNNFEINELNNKELLETINHLFETNTFIINYQDELIKLNKNSVVNEDSNINDSFTNTMVNSVKPSENFDKYQCNIDPQFDNVNLLRVKNMVDFKYRNVPHDESLTKFIKLKNENGKLKSIDSLTTCTI